MIKFAIIALAASQVLGQGGKDQIPICSVKDKELSKCLLAAFRRVHPYLVKGIPKLGVFPIDPLHIDLLDLSNAPGKTLNVRHKFMDVDIEGLASADIMRARYDIKKQEVDIDATMKKPFILRGKYQSIGKVLSLPIRGSGRFNITLHNLKSVLKMKGHEVMKNGKKYAHVDVVTFPFQVDKMELYFEDLFKGNKQISDTLNNILNENWMPILDDMKESFEEAIGSAFQQISNRALSKVPLNELLKDV
ncbi:protein takeout-like [Cimex lectularius]|uniref:Uncharacterized protein n=1 Tax=Cimex lectularius TaxID=79782 RepID=A0A8I6RLJ4_CIMLE|nr:protein takeout-like [Cimex lectularius]